MYKIKRGCFTISKKDLQVNEEIMDKEIRLIGKKGEQLGIVPIEKALQLAYSENLDLVKISPIANPAVCKIMNYGKFKFEQTKKEKETKKNQKTMEIKEIRLSINIDVNDFNTKVRKAMKFLKSGNRVKLCVRFKGREMYRTDSGLELIEKFKNKCENFATSDKPAKIEGRNIIFILIPKSNENKK